MAVTIFDLAKAANVSIGTVSKALNDHYSISEQTKAHVRALATEMKYRPNARARSFARQKNGAVIFATDLSRGIGFSNPHMFEIITGIERFLDEKGYSLLLKHMPKNEAPTMIQNVMISEQADGIILHAGILSHPLSAVLMKESLPHLVIGKPPFPCRLSWMDISHEVAGQLAANYLLDKGYRRIVFMMDNPEKDQIGLRRLNGLLEVLSEEGIPIETLEGACHLEASRVLMDELLKRKPLPEVILCTNNYLAMGCLQSVHANHISIPKDIALMTFDNYPFSMIVKPSLTAIEVDMFEMGRDAARFMLQKIHKPTLQTQSYCTTPTLVEREST